MNRIGWVPAGTHPFFLYARRLRKPLRSFFALKSTKVLRIPILYRIFATCYYAQNEYEDTLFTNNLNKTF